MAQERVSKAEMGGGGAGNVQEVAKSKPRKSVTSFLAGGGAGMLSTTLLQPLEVVKTHMQAAENVQDRRFKVVVNRILGEDGVKGLWRGTGPACVRVGLGAGLYFAVLGPMVETMRSTFASGEAYTRGEGGSLKEKLPALVTLSAGALTRSIASSVVCPITVIKTRMEYAAASGLVYRNTFHAVRTITHKEGLPGLYSGLIPTLARDAPYSGLYLLMYNRMQIFMKGAVAGGGATLLTHPPDVIRTRLQLDRGHQTSILSTVKHIVEVHGLKGLFVGVVPRAGRRALQQAFAWTIYEEIVQRVSKL